MNDLFHIDHRSFVSILAQSTAMHPHFLRFVTACVLRRFAACVLRRLALAPMVVIRDLDLALKLLSSPGPRDLDVALCCDTRNYEDLAWAAPLRALREAWARGWHRVLIDLVGCVPRRIACFNGFWMKVRLAQLMVARPRVRFLLWLDTDAAPCSHLELSIEAARGHRERVKTIKFPTLLTIWETFTGSGPRVVPRRGRLASHGAKFVSLATSGATPAPSGATPAPSGASPRLFLGYCQGGDSLIFNAGVWMFAGGAVSKRVADAWMARYPGHDWTSSSRLIGCVPGYEQYEFTKMDSLDGVIIAQQEDFCSRRSFTETPFCHFYGKGKFHGKSRISNAAVAFRSKLSTEQRDSLPGLNSYCSQFMQRSSTDEAGDYRERRAHIADSIVKALGKRVVIEGVTCPSHRAAIRAGFKTHIDKLRAAGRGDQPARGGASPARRGAQPARRGAPPARGGAQPARGGAPPARRGAPPARRGDSQGPPGKRRKA